MARNKQSHRKNVKWSRSIVFFVNFEHVFQIAVVSYCRLWIIKCQLGSLNIKIDS